MIYIFYLLCLCCFIYVFRCINELRDAIKLVRENQTLLREAINSVMDAMQSQHAINKEHTSLFLRFFENEPK